MNQTSVENFAESKFYNEHSIDIEYFRNAIYENHKSKINMMIEELDTLYNANGLIQANADKFIIESINIPTDFTEINILIKTLILQNEIESEEQFESVVKKNDLDINFLLDRNLAYVDNNVYSKRHYILKYRLDIDEYTDYWNQQL
ncbi:hypothetical protein [Staphylococcus succinus]|uniref:hypothetical protein n=1 Tax=Staphylococcus succinus TaxID=61015 RepID=UPI000E68EED3|nr:hypothetical protein [Staphylococcus succinus]RIN27711.1 hypothetical protein BU067_01510 [Staphylococcus succinus]